MKFPTDSGRASLEFLVGALILFVPLVINQTTLSTLSQAQLAAEAAARHGARVFVQHTELNSASVAVHRAVRTALSQLGIDEPPVIDLRCRPNGACLAPASLVDVAVTVSPPLTRIPLVPVSLPLEIPIRGEASAQVSAFRGQP